jgi:hypothetical protein
MNLAITAKDLFDDLRSEMSDDLIPENGFLRAAAEGLNNMCLHGQFLQGYFLVTGGSVIDKQEYSMPADFFGATKRVEYDGYELVHVDRNDIPGKIT